MRILFAIGIAVSALFLTSCSNPDTSGGVTLSKDPHPKNAPFPHGACDDDHAFDERDTGCGWISADEKSYYIKPKAYLSRAELSDHNGCGTGENAGSKGSGGIELRRAKLTDANLIGAILRGACLTWAHLTGANLSHADLTDANLMNAYLTGANLSYANLTGAYLTGLERVANLTDANLTGANLSGAYLFDTILNGADLSHADLSYSILSGVSVRKAYLSYANLTGVDLSGVDLSGAKANSSTICPNGIDRGSAGNDCGKMHNAYEGQ